MQTFGIVAIAVVLVIVIFSIIKAPIKLFFKLLLNTVIGFIVLLLLNYVGGFVGISIPVNWINAVIIGILGVPGVALILLLQWFLGR